MRIKTVMTTMSEAVTWKPVSLQGEIYTEILTNNGETV